MRKITAIVVLLIGFVLFGGDVARGDDEQRKVIEAAKKEGKVVFWTSGWSPTTASLIGEGFKKKYGLQGLQFIYAPTRTAEIIAKVSQELKAQRLTVDVINGGIPEFFYQLLKLGEVMRYDSPEYRYFPTIKGVFAEPPYWVASTAYCPTAMSWNPKYVKKAITTYTDLLDPQLKGKICSIDARKSDSGLTGYFGLRTILGRDFFVQLARQDLFWLSRTSDIANRVGTGERPVSFMGSNRSAYDTAIEGIECEISYPKEGVVILCMPFVPLAKAPHPHATRLLIDYLHSVEGQKIISDSGYFIGRKGVALSPKVAKYTPPLSDINVIPIDWKSIDPEKVEAARNEFIEIFGK